MKRLYIIAFVSFILDFVCKFIITHILSFNDSIMVIKNFFYISLVKNTGGAFSIFTGSTFLLIVISFLILLGIFTYIYKNNIRNRVSLMGFGLLIGGAMGNLFDRIPITKYLKIQVINNIAIKYPIKMTVSTLMSEILNHLTFILLIKL